MTETPSHRLRALLLAQFCSAFNDNAWKLMVALLLIRQITATVGQTGPAFEAASQTQATIAFVVFTLPLMLFSLVAGVFSDRLSKRSVIIAMKIVEVALMGAGTMVLWASPPAAQLSWSCLEPWEFTAQFSAQQNMASCRNYFPTSIFPWETGC